MVQGELFREEAQESHFSGFSGSAKKSFLSRYELSITLDKLLLGVVALLVIFVLSYSFGVERGKRIMEKRLETLIPKHSEVLATVTEAADEHQKSAQETVLIIDQPTLKAQEMPASVTAPVTPKNAEPQKPASLLPPPDLSKGRTYTIQLVTYMDEKKTAIEVNRLKAKGHEGFVIPSGPYFQVCVNYFESHSKALSWIKQFRDAGRYPGAYVRPIVR